jgi:hypothetical protein
MSVVAGSYSVNIVYPNGNDRTAGLAVLTIGDFQLMGSDDRQHHAMRMHDVKKSGFHKCEMERL